MWKAAGPVSISIQLLIAAVRAVLSVSLILWMAGCSGKAGTTTLATCSFTLSPSSASHAASGGMGSVTVTTSANCSWTARSDADWVTMTGGSSGRGNGTVTFRVAANITTSARTAAIEVVGSDGLSVPHQVSQAASTWLRIRGAYTLAMQVDLDGACGWPVTTFYWPVAIQVTSYVQGSTFGSIIFPPTPVYPSNTWSISTGPTQTRLVPGQDGPGPAGGAYDVVVDGGRWEAGGLVRAPGGKGQITNGTASGARLVLTMRGSDQRWECQSDVKWSLLVRYVDLD